MGIENVMFALGLTVFEGLSAGFGSVIAFSSLDELLPVLIHFPIQ